MVNNRYSCQQTNFRFTPFQSEYRPPYASPDSRNGKSNWPPTPKAHGVITGADDEVTDESNTNRKRIAVAVRFMNFLLMMIGLTMHESVDVAERERSVAQVTMAVESHASIAKMLAHLPASFFE